MTHLCNLAGAPARRPRRFRLYIPILLVWVLSLPLVLLLAPLVFIACLAARGNPFKGVAVFWQIFNGLRGVRVTVDGPGSAVSIQFS